MSITLNEEQREQFGALQAQYQGLRKQLTSVAAQVAVPPPAPPPGARSICGTACCLCASIRRCSAAQMSLAERDKKRHNLTLTELEGLPDGVNTYQSCGKMFVMVSC